MLSRRIADPFDVGIYDPMTSLDESYDVMDPLSVSPFRGPSGIDLTGPSSMMRWAGFPDQRIQSMVSWNPRSDISETKDAFNITTEIPGMKKEDINIELDEKGKHLVLSGHAEKEKTEDAESFHRVERFSGKFRRKFRLPNNVDAEKVKAELNHGVLKIVIPKIETGEESGRKKIDIK